MSALDHPHASPWGDDASRMRDLVERSLDLITVVTSDLTIVYQSAACERLLGRPSGELEGTKLGALIDPADLDPLRAACGQAADGIAARPVAVRIQRGDGRWLEGETLIRYDPVGQVFVLATRDVGQRNRLERRERQRSDRQALVVQLGERALDGVDLLELMAETAAALEEVLEADFVATLRYSQSAESLIPCATRGRDPYHGTAPRTGGRSLAGQALLGARPLIVREWGAEQRFEESEAVAAAGMASAIAVPIPGPSAPYGVLLVHSRARGHFGYDEGVFLKAIANVLSAASRRVGYEERIRHQALHDPTTGLPNRAVFEDRLTRALASGIRHGRRVAVMFLDLDSFQLVKEGLGLASGDALLDAFAERLASCLRAEDTLARVGGDEFAVLLPELSGQDDVLQVVERINLALRKPLKLDRREIVTSASIGIALSHGTSRPEDAQTLMRDADLAMYAAKAKGPGSAEFYAEHMHHAAVRQLELTSDLYQALERDQLEVYFQPIVSLCDEAIVGTEALVRWNHPRHGLLSPGVFLPIAEETGLIVPLGRFVLRTACTMLRRWQVAGLAARDLSVSVNLGRQQLSAPDLIADVTAALADSGLDPRCLILEITEDVLLTRVGMVERLQQLKRLGLRLAVDDFGTGYSALSHLQRYPIDIIKIDKAFVDGLGESDDHARLIRGIIELTHSLGLKTVAEGIETRRQADMLNTMGSELGQGYHFARPLPGADIEALLASPDLGDLQIAV